MSARRDYPELERIALGQGVEILEDAESQAGHALDEIDRMRDERDALVIRRDEIMRLSGAALRELADSMDADFYPGSDIIRAANAEVDGLRRWKAEAMQVLDHWELVWEAAGQPGPLGSSKALAVRARLTALNDGVLTVTAELHAEVARLRSENTSMSNMLHSYEQAFGEDTAAAVEENEKVRARVVRLQAELDTLRADQYGGQP